MKGARLPAQTGNILDCLRAHRGVHCSLTKSAKLPMRLQPKLLRVLEENEIRRVGGTEQIPVSVRVLTATNIDLIEAVAAGRFRRDLYERLKSLHIQLPALRERREDIPALVIHFLKKETNCCSQKTGDINPEVLSLFDAYSWRLGISESWKASSVAPYS